MKFSHPKTKMPKLSRKNPISLLRKSSSDEPDLFLQDLIGQFHRIYTAHLAHRRKNEEEEATEEISPAPVPFSQAFSVFTTVEWSELTKEAWILFGTSGFFDFVYMTLTSDLNQILSAPTRRIQAISELDDVVRALIVVLEFMTREDSVILRVGVYGNTLTDLICRAILSPDPGPNSNTFILLSSLITKVDKGEFSPDCWSHIGDWLASVLDEPYLSNVPETFWDFMLTVGSDPFPGFFQWFTTDFLRHCLLNLLVSHEPRPISADFFQFLALLWDSDPDSHPIFLANGVQAFLGRRLLSPTGPDFPELSLRLLARCSSESESCCPFPLQQLIACLGWEEASPDAAFAMAGFAVAGKSPGWEDYLDDTVLAQIAQDLMSGDFTQVEIVLRFLWELLWACYTENIDPDRYLPFARITFGLWRDSEKSFNLAYRPLCLLARWFIEKGHLEDDLPGLIRGEDAEPLTVDDDAYFRGFVHDLCTDECMSRGPELHQALSRKE
jgi:hypothetical protein